MKEQVAPTVVRRTAVSRLCYIPESNSAVNREVGGSSPFFGTSLQGKSCPLL
jgi:hypothetical protein